MDRIFRFLYWYISLLKIYVTNCTFSADSEKYCSKIQFPLSYLEQREALFLVAHRLQPDSVLKWDLINNVDFQCLIGWCYASEHGY